MNWQQYIEQRPDVMMGMPVIRGTRLTVEFLLERLGDGEPEAELLAAHPRLKPEHIRAAQAFAIHDLHNHVNSPALPRRRSTNAG